MGGTAAKAAEPVLQTEQSDVITLPPYSPHTILVEDAVYTHNKDGRVYVVDADSGKLLGMVQAAYNGNMALTPDAKRIYVQKPRGNAATAAHGTTCWPNMMPARLSSHPMKNCPPVRWSRPKRTTSR